MHHIIKVFWIIDQIMVALGQEPIKPSGFRSPTFLLSNLSQKTEPFSQGLQNDNSSTSLDLIYLDVIT